MTSMILGDARIDALVDIDAFCLPLRFLFPAADVAQLEGDRAWLEPNHLDGDVLQLSIHSILLRVDGRVILIDTCVGEDKPRPNRPEWDRRAATGYLDRLAALGVQPEEVDTVLCTHLHADHVGWNTRRRADGCWTPTFPRARYLVGRRELAHWEAHAACPGPAPNHGAYVDSVAPVIETGQLDAVGDEHELHRGIVLMPLPGHTPGQVGLTLDRGARALFCGDAVHSPVQFVRPDWSTSLCTDPDGARDTRELLLAEVAETNAWLAPAHLRGAPACRLRRHGDSYRPVEP